MATRTLITKRRLILYDDTLASHADAELFSPQRAGEHGGLRGAPGGRGQTWIVAGGNGEWVLRHYRRGGLVAKFITDYYLWTGSERTRPWREWHLLSQLYKEGLPVPQPVAAQVTHHGLLYRGDLITRLIPDARSLAACLDGTGIELVPWREIGRCLRRFHDAGVYHADLNAHNILLNRRNDVYLIDFDRGERRLSDTTWQEASQKRLLRSLRKLTMSGLIETHAWPALLGGYQSKVA